MRLIALALLCGLPATLLAQTPGGDRTYPAQWVPLLQVLTKSQVDKMQLSANEYCKSLDYATVRELYSSLSDCTLMQATAIMGVDTALSDLQHDRPTEHRPRQVARCWSIYRALGSRDVENLANCFGDIEHFELLQRVAGTGRQSSQPSASAYCDKVAEASGGSYMILEECIKQENASRRRLGR